MSIWEGLDRKTFERNVAKLRKRTHRQLPLYVDRHAPGRSRGDGEVQYVLPLGVETRLAEDFAFLSATSSDPGCVAAATVAPMKDGAGLMVSLSANEGISDRARQKLEACLELLRQCASCTISRDTCAEACCQEMVTLNCTRIHDRLQYMKSGRSIQVLSRLQGLSAHIKALEGIATAKQNELLCQVEALMRAIRGLQGSHSSDNHANPSKEAIKWLVRAVKSAFDLVYGSSFDFGFEKTSINGSLENRLRTLGLDNSYGHRREVRTVQKLAAYWRICLYLSVCARSYHHVFENLTMHILRAPKPEVWPAKRGIKHFVHAEIQLVVYHETTSYTAKPRAIAASKLPCFLCSSFIVSYGSYSIPISHGEVYEQWTIPDLPAFTDLDRSTIRNAIRATAGTVDAALAAPELRKSNMQPPKPQSLLDLTIHALKKASIFSLRSDPLLSIISGSVLRSIPSSVGPTEAKLEVGEEQHCRLSFDPRKTSGALVVKNSLQPALRSSSPHLLEADKQPTKFAFGASVLTGNQSSDQEGSKRRHSAMCTQNKRVEERTSREVIVSDLGDDLSSLVAEDDILVHMSDQYLSDEAPRADRRSEVTRNCMEAVKVMRPSNACLALGTELHDYASGPTCAQTGTSVSSKSSPEETQASLRDRAAYLRINTYCIPRETTKIFRHHWLELHISMEQVRASDLFLDMSGFDSPNQAGSQTIHLINLSVGDVMTLPIDSGTGELRLLIRTEGVNDVEARLQVIDAHPMRGRDEE